MGERERQRDRGRGEDTNWDKNLSITDVTQPFPDVELKQGFIQPPARLELRQYGKV